MYNKKLSLLFLNICCNSHVILATLTQMFLSFISLIINFYSNKTLTFNYSLSSYLFLNLFYLSIIVIIIIFFLFLLFMLNYKIAYFILIPFIFFSFLLDAAYADDTIIKISSDTKSNDTIPFSQFLDASLTNDSSHRDLAQKVNISPILGKNASSLDNSYSLLHQTVAASRPELASPQIAMVSTDAIIKYEVAYIKDASLSQSELIYYLNKFKTPIISKNNQGFWILTIYDSTSRDLKTTLLNNHDTLNLNSFIHNSQFFGRSAENLYVLRLGDMIAFDVNTLKIVNSVEFKTSQIAIDSNNLDVTFNKRFFKSILVDNQLFDSFNKKFYYKYCGDSQAKLLDINNLIIDNTALTEKFKLGRKLATNIQNQPLLKQNLISFILNNIFKFVK